MMPKFLRRLLPPLVVVAAIVAVWQLVVTVWHISGQILPSPLAIATALGHYPDVIVSATWQTLFEAVAGLAIATALGVATALLLDSSAALRCALYPLLITSQTIPIIALAPLLLIWLGFGLAPKLIVVVLYCFFPVAVAMAHGLASVDPEHINLFRTMRASYWQTLRLLKIPAALPAFFSGLKIAVTYSLTAAIVGEYTGAYSGLGVLIQSSANAHAVPLVFAVIFVTSCLSLALFLAVLGAERLATPWNRRPQ